jgi:hypothetical protein
MPVALMTLAALPIGSECAGPTMAANAKAHDVPVNHCLNAMKVLLCVNFLGRFKFPILG